MWDFLSGMVPALRCRPVALIATLSDCTQGTRHSRTARLTASEGEWSLTSEYNKKEDCITFYVYIYFNMWVLYMCRLVG